MTTTINIDSYDDINVKERSTIAAPVAAGATSLTVHSSELFAVNDVIYVGDIGRDGTEKAVVQAVPDGTTLTLTQALKLAHNASETVLSVIGDQVRIYRAPYVPSVLPDDSSFAVLANVTLAADQPSTYYRDPSGSSAYWYRYSYASSTTTDETVLSAAFRGDDFGHYASLREIRSEAGFDNAYNLRDSVIDQQRRAAESEINATFATNYQTPFAPVPDMVHTFTVQLAAALLKNQQYGGVASAELKSIRAQIALVASKPGSIVDDAGQSLASDSITSLPDDDAPRSFYMGQTF